MKGYLTVCFSNWKEEIFTNGIMRIKNGKRTDDPIRRPLKPGEMEGIHYYIKPDPDFFNFTYSRCHRRLRQQLQKDDILFFRTLWREKQYIIGYFTIKEKVGAPEDPICVADPKQSLLIHYELEVTPGLVYRLNPHAQSNRSRHINMWINERLGRDYLMLGPGATTYLKYLIETGIP
ncbi:hypothetical protein MYX07_04675 [Patescibacteria group bacterium AH-259-L07]|nr:hypothetical protein [Patescibacteria group bacterium AH-259-L07]